MPRLRTIKPTMTVLSILSVFTIMLTACSTTSTKSAVKTKAAEPTINIVDTVSGANFQAYWKQTWIPEIEHDLGIKVTYTLDTGSTLETDVKTWSPGHAEFNLFFIKGLDLSNLVSENAPLVSLYPKEQTAISNESAEPKTFLASNDGVSLHGKGLIMWRAQFDLVYNSADIKNPPRTWQQFYAERNTLKGHIGIIAPSASSGGGRAFVYSFLSAFGVNFNLPYGQLVKSAAWTSAWAKFKIFSQDFASPIASSPTVLFHQMDTNQVWVTDYAQDYSLWSTSQGLLPPTTRAVALNSNVVGASNAWFAVPTADTAAQKAAAYRIINFMLSKSTQLDMLHTMYEYPGTNYWKDAPASDFTKIPPLNVAEGKGIEMTNLDAIKYIEENALAGS
jgi:putative spermidine/putrescine transport system substrate-binding protein